MISFEDFLLQTSKIIDPFHRFVSRVDPFITMVEFCQVVGPKPIKIISSETNDKVSNVDVNEMAIWLMSSDTIPGTIVILENTQTGIYAAAYYFNLYDIRARAFQRNLCIAYLSSQKPDKTFLNKFSADMKAFISPLLICNRRLFIRHVSDIVQYSNEIDETTLQQYYTLEGDSKKVPDVGRFNVVFEQTRQLKCKFLTKKFQHTMFEDDICNGHDYANLQEAEEIISSFRIPSIPLSHVESLIPCAYPLIEDKLRFILNSFKQGEIEKKSLSTLYSAGRPVVRFSKCDESLSTEELLDNEIDENTLNAIIGHLGDILFPILSGEDVVVCGNEQRKPTVVDLLTKLSWISLQPNATFRSPSIENDPNKITVKLGGLECKRQETGKLVRWNHIIDMNRCIFKTFNYNGKLLEKLNKKRKFSSDRSLIYFIAAYLTRLCSLAYLFKYFLKNFQSSKIILHDDDIKIIENILIYMDIEKYGHLKKRRSNAVKSCTYINL